jgi:nucleotide-binding universal stress UspA family protein
VPQKILVAYDFNAVSDKALEWAADVAKQTGAQLTLLHVVLIPPPAIAPDAVIPLVQPTALDTREAEDRLRKVLAARGTAGHVDAMTAAHVGAAVVARAHELSADLIVIGTHNRGALARAFMGSVATHVVHHADCPVVTVREPHGKHRG